MKKLVISLLVALLALVALGLVVHGAYTVDMAEASSRESFPCPGGATTYEQSDPFGQNVETGVFVPLCLNGGSQTLRLETNVDRNFTSYLRVNLACWGSGASCVIGPAMPDNVGRDQNEAMFGLYTNDPQGRTTALNVQLLKWIR